MNERFEIGDLVYFAGDTDIMGVIVKKISGNYYKWHFIVKWLERDQNKVKIINELSSIFLWYELIKVE